MRCPEFREVMGMFLDGEVDGRTRRDIGLHLAKCPECAALVDDNRFWNEKLSSYLQQELPVGLREQILGDLADLEVDQVPGDRKLADLDNLGWRHHLRIAWWAIKRDLNTPRKILQTAAVSVVVVLAVIYLPLFQSPDKEERIEAFSKAGPIVQMGDESAWKPGEYVPTARLSISGRLI